MRTMMDELVLESQREGQLEQPLPRAERRDLPTFGKAINDVHTDAISAGDDLSPEGEEEVVSVNERPCMPVRPKQSPIDP